MKFIYTIFAILAIFIISLFAFREDIIYYNYAKYTTNKETNITNNNYFYEDNFAYIDYYDGIEIHNKNELYGVVYYAVNNGLDSIKRYFSIDYKDFEKDYSELFSNEKKLNIINNFVHPYNSFSSIEASLKGYVLELKIKYKEVYDENNKILIDNKVNDIINENIKPDMDLREQIKVIHDYIINNTKYDNNFCVRENPSECNINSIYKSDSAYGVLFEHNGICSGYTDVMAIFLNRLGIINYRLTNKEHTWNAVKLNDNWYHLDVTWDDPISNEKDILSHSYFLISTAKDRTLSETHDFNKEVFIELS